MLTLARPRPLFFVGLLVACSEPSETPTHRDRDHGTLQEHDGDGDGDSKRDDERDRSDAGDSDGDGDGDGDDRTSDGDEDTARLGEVSREHGVVFRRCSRPAYGRDWLFVPTSTDCEPNCFRGTECRRNEDCDDKPHGKCIGLADGHCEYAEGTGVLSDYCEQDSQCTSGSDGVCKREITLTFCLYDRCETTSDCGSDEVCQCATEDADPECVSHGCERAEDCGAGRTCLTDMSYAGAPNFRHCSSASDECTKNADCVSKGVDDSCGYDVDKNRWVCRPFALID